MTVTVPPGTAERLTATSAGPRPTPSPGESEPLVPLSDPTWDQTVIDWLKTRAGTTPVDDPLFLQAVEYWRVPVLFHNRYVVFRDVSEGEGEDRRLIRREIYLHTPDIAEVRAFLKRVPVARSSEFDFHWSEGNR
jgi:hypothetical protein